jgi:hypothetical protein
MRTPARKYLNATILPKGGRRFPELRRVVEVGPGALGQDPGAPGLVFGLNASNGRVHDGHRVQDGDDGLLRGRFYESVSSGNFWP